MKRSIVGAVLGASFLIAPLAYAQTTSVPIGDPYTDTVQLWSEMASAVSSLAHDLATLFNGNEFTANNQVPTPQTEPQSGAAAAVVPTQSQQLIPHFITYTVESGNTLSGIAQNYGVSLASLLAANDLSQRAVLTPGETLTIPNPQTAPAVASSGANSKPTTSSQSHTSAQSSSSDSASGNSTTILDDPAPEFDTNDYVTQNELATSLLSLSNSLAAKVAPTTTPTVQEWILGDGNPSAPYAAENNISQLSGVTITNANLTASEIPALDYLSLNGGTLTGALSVPTLDASSTNYGLITSTNASSTNLSNFGAAYFGGTATSSFDSAGDLTVAGNTTLANATSTTFFATTASSTNLFSTAAHFGSVVISSLTSAAATITNLIATTITGTNLTVTNATTTNATTTNLYVSNTASIGSLTGFLKAVGGMISTSTINLAGDVAGILPFANGGTGTTTATGVTASIEFVQSTSTAVARTVQSKLSDTISVKDFGATGNALRYSNGVISSGSNAFSSQSATFTSADVGKVIWIDYAGPSGTPMQTTITGFINSHDVSLGENASTSIPYSFLYSVSVTTAQSGSGSYAPGDTITLSGGTASVPAVITVKRTDVVSAALVSGGTGGTTTNGATTGSCTVTGTTGVGERLFTLTVTITSGAITSINNITASGQYSTNPTNLTSEPVTGCGSLSGATVSLVMGVEMPIVTTQGDYSATASTLTQASTSGSGTGATFTPFFVTTGNFTYGTDDTQAWTNAINYVVQLDQSGVQTCLYAPAGYYLITSSLPIFYHAPGCVKGDGPSQTYILPAPSLAGDVFSFSEDWVGNNNPLGGASTITSSPEAGPNISNLQILGDDTSTNLQYGVSFYDRDDYVVMQNVFMQYLTASCIRTGYTLNEALAYTRESQFTSIYCNTSGTSTAPAIDINSAGGGDGSNELHFDTVNIYAPHGPGFVIRNQGTGVTRAVSINQLRVEGEQGDQGLFQGDLVRIGDSSLTGLTDYITISGVHLVNPYLGYAAMRITANSTSTTQTQPHGIIVTDGDMVAAPGFGRGLEIDSGYSNSFTFQEIPTIDYQIYVGPTPLVGSNNQIFVNGTESSLYTHIDPSAIADVGTTPSFQSINSLQLFGAALGVGALGAITSGNYDTALGWNAGAKLTTAVQDTFVGAAAGQSHTTGNDDVLLGYGAGSSETTAFDEVCIGADSCASNTQGNDNTVVGENAGHSLTSGTENIILGYNPLNLGGLTSARDTIEIGTGLQVLPQTAYAQLDIGNLLFGAGLASTSVMSTGGISIGTTSASARLSVWGVDAASSTSAFNVVNSASTTLFSIFDGGNAELSGSLSQSSDERLKTNIQSLEAPSSLSLIDELNPVTFNWIDPNQTTTLQLGFIAQQVQQIFPNLVSTTSPTSLTPDGTLSLNYIGLISPIVSAIQELSADITSIESTIAGFANSFTTTELTYTRATGTDLTLSQELCIDQSDGTPVCVTGDQLAAVLSAANASQSAGQENNGGTENASSSNSATDTPPQLQINGNNPAVVQVGDTYNDLGATITGPTADLNLSIKTYLNGTLTSDIVIDTTQAATDTVQYVATDQNGLTSTSTRTVVIEAPALPPPIIASTTTPFIVPTANASTTADTTQVGDAGSADNSASTTAATTTAQ